MSLLVAGLTGSGKTSSTRTAAATLKYRWISGSDLRRQHVFNKPQGTTSDRIEHAISEENLAAENARIRDPSQEQAFDVMLMRMALSLERAIFDVWFLPWLMPQKAPRAVFLEASLTTRVTRISDLINSQDPAQATLLIESKDDRARNFALSHYGIDIFTDRTPFYATIKTDEITTVQVAKFLCALATPGELDNATIAQLLGHPAVTICQDR